MQTSDAQVRKLMEEMSKQGQVGLASLRAGMDRKTGRKYVKAGKLPSELKEPRSWRTRPDAFEQDWPRLEEQLKESPTLEAKTLMAQLRAEQPGRYEPGQLRTLQRRVRRWRAQEGPDKEVFFSQEHVPGEAAQTDFTWGNELRVTVCGAVFLHMLCHVVLPYSNWHYVTVCLSESLAAIRRGVQAALFRLGRVPEFHQTDHSTAATHELGGGERGFNEEYLGLMRHLGMKPRTIGVGKKEQNGDVEAQNGTFKRRLEQQLLLRGSRDFESREAYEGWAQVVAEQDNRALGERLLVELGAMGVLRVERLAEYREQDVRVSGFSTIRVKHNAYSVPSRLIGEVVQVRVYEDRLEVFYQGKQELSAERLLGRNGHRVNYRHIIWSLVKKPGAFARYVYREDLFPTVVFRRAYDALCLPEAGTKAELEYLRVLHLAASTMEAEVEAALELLLEQGKRPAIEAVKALCAPGRIEVPELAVLGVDLTSYDTLLGGAVAS